jgi:hypothetical protein
MMVVVTSRRKDQFAGDAPKSSYVSDVHRKLARCLLYANVANCVANCRPCFYLVEKRFGDTTQK